MGGGEKEAWDPLPDRLQELGYVVLIFDFRGHGDSTGELDPPSAATDLTTALEYLLSLSQVDGERIGLVGASMGGMASVIVGARESHVKAVVAVSTSPGAAGQRPIDVVGQLGPRPFLTLGCDEDPITRPERVNQLYEAANEPKQIVILTCSAHGNDILGTTARPELVNLIVGWLTQYVQ
jgi:dienelactone hydrolase